jgi:hypothetical protein
MGKNLSFQKTVMKFVVPKPQNRPNLGTRKRQSARFADRLSKRQ